jgi:hypothetical protein
MKTHLLCCVAVAAATLLGTASAANAANPSHQWWVFAFDDYTCGLASKNIAGFSSPAAAHNQLRRAGVTDKVTVMSTNDKGEPQAVAIEFATGNDPQGASIYFFDEKTSCELFKIALAKSGEIPSVDLDKLN